MSARAPSPTVFRILLLASFALALLATSVDRIFPELVVPALRAVLDGAKLANDHSSNISFAILGLIMLVTAIISTYGLFRFRRWSRALSVLSTVVGLPLYVLKGQFVLSGYSEVFGQLSLLLGGAVIACAYWSPLRERFERNDG